MKPKSLLLVLIYAVFWVSLFLPYSYGLHVGKVHFAYQSTPSAEFKSRFDTTYLGIQSLFGMINTVIVVILFFTKKSRKELTTIIILLAIYLGSIFISNILNSFSGIGSPFPDEFLFGRQILITSTLALFVFYINSILKKVKTINKVEPLQGENNRHITQKYFRFSWVTFLDKSVF